MKIVLIQDIEKKINSINRPNLLSLVMLLLIQSRKKYVAQLCYEWK